MTDKPKVLEWHKKAAEEVIDTIQACCWGMADLEASIAMHDPYNSLCEERAQVVPCPYCGYCGTFAPVKLEQKSE